MIKKSLLIFILLFCSILYGCNQQTGTTQPVGTSIKPSNIPTPAKQALVEQPTNDQQNKHPLNTSGIISISGKYYDTNQSFNVEVLKNLSKDDLGIIRNAIYAKHGYKFKKSTYSSYFSKYDWYKPTYDNIDRFMTKEDKANIDLILNLENNPMDLSGKDFEVYYEGITIRLGDSFHKNIQPHIGLGTASEDNNYGYIGEAEGSQYHGYGYPAREPKFQIIVKDEAMISQIHIADLGTNRGVKKGDTLDKIKGLYGNPSKTNHDEFSKIYTYQFKDKSLTFIFDKQSGGVDQIYIAQH